MARVTSYARFAAFYDQVMGDRTTDVDRVLAYVARYRPGAATLLELGCGTGALLAGLAAAGLKVSGVDASPEMLDAAADRVPGADLTRADITAVALHRRFDVVICVFDTVNHLADFAQWRELFGRVREHLEPGGLFLFDVNTLGRLRRLRTGPAFAEDFGEHTMIMDVLPGEGDLSVWTVRIFERTGEDQFRLHAERIPELGVPLERIGEALDPGFELLELTDTAGNPATDDSGRAYFACRRR